MSNFSRPDREAGCSVEVGEWGGGEEYRREREMEPGENRPRRIRDGGAFRVRVREAVEEEFSGRSGLVVDMALSEDIRGNERR